MKKKNYPTLPQVMVDGKPIYPGLAQAIYEDAIYGPRIQRRLKRLVAERSEGLNRIGHHWYFGYLVCAYTQTHYGVKNLLNFPSVTEEIYDLCLAANNPGGDRIC